MFCNSGSIQEYPIHFNLDRRTSSHYALLFRDIHLLQRELRLIKDTLYLQLVELLLRDLKVCFKYSKSSIQMCSVLLLLQRSCSSKYKTSLFDTDMVSQQSCSNTSASCCSAQEFFFKDHSVTLVQGVY